MKAWLVLLLTLAGEPTPPTRLDTAGVPCKSDADCKNADRLKPNGYRYICDITNPDDQSGICRRGCRSDADCRGRPGAHKAAVCRTICSDREPGICPWKDCFNPAGNDSQ
jgi:hypothetical protein